MLADELPDLGDAGVLLHLEHRAGDLVLPLELGEALVGVPVHAAELPHAEGGQAAVAMGLTHSDLAVERVALALQADGRGKHKAGYGDDGQHAAAEHDVERALDGAVGQARVVPVHDGLHSLISTGAFTLVHGLSNQRCPRGRIALCHFFISNHNKTNVPVPRNPPSMNQNANELPAQRLPYVLLGTSNGSSSLNVESPSPTSTRHQRL